MAERIGIIGGGFSGLLTAYLLEQRFGDQIDIVIWEAQNRVGGRVLTPLLPELGVTYEAGVAELYDIAGNPQLRQLIGHLGLDTRPLNGTPYFVIDDRIVRDNRALTDRLGPRAVDRVRRFWDQGTTLRPPADYALAGREQDNDHPWQRRTFAEVLAEIDDDRGAWFTAMQCHSDLATEPQHTSGLFGMDNLLIDHPGYCSMYTLDAGNEGLVSALAGRVRAAVHRGVRVHTVDGQPDRGLEVTVQRAPGERERCDVDALVVTLPPPGIRDITWHDATLNQAVAGHVRHHDHGTTYLRVTLVCRHRVWRRLFPEDYFVSDAFGGVTVYDQSPDDGATGVGVQSWLLGGTPAGELLSSSDEDIVGLVRQAMPSQISLSDTDVLASRVDRWTGVAGVSALPGGVPLRPVERRHRPDPRWPQLLFIGDYLYDATLCGALDAVRYAVAGLTEKLQPTNRVETGGRSSLFAATPSKPSSPPSTFFMDR